MNNENVNSLMVGLRHRAQRIAYLVPRNPNIDVLRKIAIYSSQVWGGIFSVIIEIDDDQIDNRGWNLLRYFNPDTIYSFLQISDELNITLNDRVFPARIIADHPNFLEGNLNYYNAGIIGLIERVQPIYDDLNSITFTNCSQDSECYDDVLFNLGLISYEENLILSNYHKRGGFPSRIYSPQTHADFIRFPENPPYLSEWIRVSSSCPLHYTMNENSQFQVTSARKRNLEIYIYSGTHEIINFWNNRSVHYSDHYIGYNSLLLNQDAILNGDDVYQEDLVNLIKKDIETRTPKRGTRETIFILSSNTDKSLKDAVYKISKKIF